jgi:cytochrome c peroxidase
LFQSTETEILGVATRPDTAGATLDPDVGRAGGILREQVAIYRNSFKTPTVRNIALTAPYMHNGAYTSLHEVVKFYDLGGGAGIGIDHPYQTLAADRLDFSERDYDDLIAFMQALTDTSGTTQVPHTLPQFSDPRFARRPIGGAY